MSFGEKQLIFTNKTLKMFTLKHNKKLILNLLLNDGN